MEQALEICRSCKQREEPTCNDISRSAKQQPPAPQRTPPACLRTLGLKMSTPFCLCEYFLRGWESSSASLRVRRHPRGPNMTELLRQRSKTTLQNESALAKRNDARKAVAAARKEFTEQEALPPAHLIIPISDLTRSSICAYAARRSVSELLKAGANFRSPMQRECSRRRIAPRSCSAASSAPTSCSPP